MDRTPGSGYLAYTLTLTVISLAILTGMTLAGFGLEDASNVDWVQLVLLLLIAIVTRGMSLELLDIKVSLDTAILVAGAFSLPPLLAGWLVFAATAGFDLCRIAMEPDAMASGGGQDPWWRQPLRSVFAGSVSAALMAGCAVTLDVHEIYLTNRGVDDAPVLWAVPIFVMSWLPAQYFIVGASFRLAGRRWSQIIREVLLPGFVAEVSLIPLAILLVLVYEPTDPTRFIILACISVLFVFILRRLTATSKKLLARVRELELLNAFGRLISSTLDAEALSDRIADGVLSVYPNADECVLVLKRSSDGDLEHLVYGKDGKRRAAPSDESGLHLAQWILETGMEDSGGMGAGSIGGRARNWAGVPIVSRGEVVGAMLVHVGKDTELDTGRMRLLQLISRQASVALENSSLYELATVDGLTGLFVRRYFDQRVEEEFQRAMRYGSSFGVVMLDVDDFKEVNDRYLHTTGDSVLQMVSAVMRSCIRGMDVPCRLGGDEFAVILPEANEANACTVAQRICDGVNALSIAVDGHAVSVTVSVGVGSYPECGVEAVQEMMKRVDTALYSAKATAGKNVVCGYSTLQALSR
jgi:diguanylate cyclase (GGDEF)-like protein